MKQLPFPNLSNSLPVKGVTAFVKLDSRSLVQGKFYKDLSMWLSFKRKVDNPDPDMLNLLVYDVSEGHMISIDYNHQPLARFFISAEGKIRSIPIKKGSKNANPQTPK